MRQIYSSTVGIGFLFMNTSISQFFPETMQPIISILMVATGSALLGWALYDEMQKRKSFQEEEARKQTQCMETFADFCAQLKSQSDTDSKSLREVIHRDSEQIVNKIISLTEATNQMSAQIKRDYESDALVLKKISEILDQIKIQNTEDNKDLQEAINQISEQTANKFTSLTEAMNQLNTQLKSNVKYQQMQCQMMDEIINSVEHAVNDHKDLFEDMTDDMADSYRGLISAIKKEIGKMIDEIDDNQQQMMSSVSDMSQQYSDFKKYNETMINQMKLMNDTDYKMMKELFNGKNR